MASLSTAAARARFQDFIRTGRRHDAVADFVTSAMTLRPAPTTTRRWSGIWREIPDLGDALREAQPSLQRTVFEAFVYAFSTTASGERPRSALPWTRIFPARWAAAQGSHPRFAITDMAGGGFEPPKAEPMRLQRIPFDRSGIPPGGR